MLEIILESFILGSYGLSTLITILNHSCSNSRIRRKGFEIKPITNNSILENIKYGIKDFGFLIVPGYNFIRSIQDTAKKDSEFDSIKMERLTDRDRLVKKEEKVEKMPEKTSAPIEKEIKEEPKKEEQKTEAIDLERKFKENLAKMSCYERREHCKNKYNQLLILHTRSKKEGKSVAQLNEIVRYMNMVVAEYNKAKRECELEELKVARNNSLSSMSDSAKLIRK